jgi:hypothetical protein
MQIIAQGGLAKAGTLDRRVMKRRCTLSFAALTLLSEPSA